MQRPFFTILGGMGTLATESLISTINRECGAKNDQDYLDYILFNDAGTPDRTAYINDSSSPSPLPTLLDNVKKSAQLGAKFIVLPCNTAHYFYSELQEATTIPILHMPRLALDWAQAKLPPATHPRIGFLGTEGSLRIGIYRQCVEEKGYRFVEPKPELQALINDLIYLDVKGTRGPNEQRFLHVLKTMMDSEGPYKCDALILGCTEISVLNDHFAPDLPLIDAQRILASATIQQARKLRVPD